MEIIFLTCFFIFFMEDGKPFQHVFCAFFRLFSHAFFLNRFYFLVHFLFLNSQIILEIEKRYILIRNQTLFRPFHFFLVCIIYFIRTSFLFFMNYFFVTFLGNRTNFFRCFFGFFFAFIGIRLFSIFKGIESSIFFFTTFFFAIYWNRIFLR